jgi:hypothetical protein
MEHKEKDDPQEVAHWGGVIVLLLCVAAILATLVLIKMDKAKQARIEVALSARAERDYHNCVRLFANVVEPVTPTHAHYYYVSPEPDIGMLMGYTDDAGATVVRGDHCPAHPKAEWVNQAPDVAIVSRGSDGKFSYQAPPWLLGSWTLVMRE